MTPCSTYLEVVPGQHLDIIGPQSINASELNARLSALEPNDSAHVEGVLIWTDVPVHWDVYAIRVRFTNNVLRMPDTPTTGISS